MSSMSTSYIPNYDTLLYTAPQADMGNTLSALDKCFQPNDTQSSNEISNLPAPSTIKPAAPSAQENIKKSSVKTTGPEPAVVSQPKPIVVTETTPLAVTEAPKGTPVEPPHVAEGATDSSSGLNTGCEGKPMATGTYIPQVYKYDEAKKTIIVDTSNFPEVTNEFVTDGKVVFDKAALSIPGVIPTRAEEIEVLDSVKALKNEASQATKDAAEKHASAQPFFDAADQYHKEGKHDEKKKAMADGKAVMAEATALREVAKQKHEEASQAQYNVAMSGAIKAMYTKEFEYDLYGNGSKMEKRYPEIDYHFYLEAGMAQTIDAAHEIMRQNKFGSKSILYIPGAGSHSAPGKCVTIPCYKDFVKRHNFEQYETEITHGSWRLDFP